MTYFILKAALSGILIAIVSEVSRRYPNLGGLIASLPLLSIIAIIWLWRDTGGDVNHVATHARATLWFVIPSLPMFLILPAFLESGLNFWVALALSCLLTILFYLAAIWLAGRFGLNT